MDAANGTVVLGNVATLACGNCIYWQRAPIDPSRIGVRQVSGFCKRNPPVPLLVMGENKLKQIVPTVQPAFPPTVETEWCGEHAFPGDDEDAGDDASVSLTRG